jgi:hypothetical protein
MGCYHSKGRGDRCDKNRDMGVVHIADVMYSRLSCKGRRKTGRMR